MLKAHDEPFDYWLVTLARRYTTDDDTRVQRAGTLNVVALKLLHSESVAYMLSVKVSSLMMENFGMEIWPLNLSCTRSLSV